jgi:CDP-glucose 4,6-dehydratase
MSTRIDRRFWLGKRVLVTGHTGFKGAWLVQILSQLGARVAGLALEPEEPSLYAQAGVASLLDAEALVDLGQAEPVMEFARAFDPQIILHLAAQSFVRRSHRQPVETFASNVMGTVHLLEAVRACPSAKTVLVTTTDKVYFNAETGVPFREGDRLGGTEPYSASKAATELVIAAWRRSYLSGRGISLISARAGNVLGGGDWGEDNLLPDAIRAVMAGVPLKIRNPAAVRPWQHVLDVLEGYMLLAERMGHRLEAAEPEDLAWNIGPDPKSGFVAVEQLCDWLKEQWPERFSWQVEVDGSGIKENHLLLLDPAKAGRDTGWSARFDPKEALQETLKWYAGFMEGADARELCAGQISAFFGAGEAGR